MINTMAFFRKLCLFSLASFFSCHSAWAWNEDYSSPPPGQRTVCIKDLPALWRGQSVDIRSIPPDQNCEKGENRYQWVIGQEPKGAMALIPNKSLDNTYPPWVPSWP